MLNQLPLVLIYSRLAFGIIIVLLASFKGPDAIIFIIALIVAGLLSDIFDGIIARNLGIATVRLRKLDSIVDRIFWLLVLIACAVLYPKYMYSKIDLMLLVIVMESLVFGLSLLRFCRIPSPHNFLSKLWGLLVAIVMIDIILNGSSLFLFNSMIALGVISRLDSFVIHILLKKWDHDIPSFYHAYLIRNGIEFKRNKLFN